MWQKLLQVLNREWFDIVYVLKWPYWLLYGKLTGDKKMDYRKHSKGLIAVYGGLGGIMTVVRTIWIQHLF